MFHVEIRGKEGRGACEQTLAVSEQQRGQCSLPLSPRRGETGLLWVLPEPKQAWPRGMGHTGPQSHQHPCKLLIPSSHQSRRKPELKGQEDRNAQVAMATGMQESLRTVSLLLLHALKPGKFLLTPGVGTQSKE